MALWAKLEDVAHGERQANEGQEAQPEAAQA